MNNKEQSPLYPLTFSPVLKDYIWGGRNLAARLGRDLPPDGPIAESWEIAAHPNGDVRIDNGPLSGTCLSELHERMGIDLIGQRATWAQQRGKFPLLIKILDAHRKLSVQVHPNDEYARENEGNELGKTEMWVVLHAEPGAELVLGVRRNTTPEAFRAALAKGALERHLHHIPVQQGDFVCVPSGSLHAIMGGLLIAEIQQNSDTTYRVYDWNRVGHDGKPRPLHIEKALDVINFEQVEPSLPQEQLIRDDGAIQVWELCRNRYFVVERVALTPGTVYHGSCDGTSLEIWGTIAGKATVTGGTGSATLPAIRFALLPAALGPFTVAADEAVVLLRTYLPAASE